MMEKVAVARYYNQDISLKKAIEICDLVRYKELNKAKNVLSKINSKAAKRILKLIENAEANAKNLNLNLNRLYIKKIVANKGEKFIRPKTRSRFRGRIQKSTHLEVVLAEK